MYIPRTMQNSIKDKILSSNKIIILYGPRQVGKTTLIKNILQKLTLKTLSINADEQKYIDIFSSRDLNKLKLLVSGYNLLFIDEAQRIPDIGINLKILHDNLPNLKIVTTGSSSFELANKIKEPLTGRTWTFNLYPISQYELSSFFNKFELLDKLEQLLVFGAYPEIFSIENLNDKTKYLEEITSSYLYRDVLSLSNIKHPNKIIDLLKLLSFQIGSQVSVKEIASSIGMARETVDSYIDLLEKSFVVFRLRGFSRNLRKEVTKMDKIYFNDLGIRNTLINNHNLLINRNDQGQLWENFLINERIKLLKNDNQLFSNYFWRLYTGAEIDYIEETEGKLNGYEFKYNKKIAKCPKTWQDTYPTAGFKCVNMNNYLDFIT